MESIMVAMYIMLCLVCCFISFLSGFLLGKGKESKKGPRGQPELSEEDKIKVKKAQKEYENFLTYDGSSQE